ncbi:hypothetical protein [Lysinibacter sp. HNR]|uniref:hypothetical protein n=1 Tax=Lysinibacter sp. HNR TaxID=3031408 RepID=UPI0024354335|nr:hypothetical protein [Lysinibacter sp. HNR]WGD38021.1 hypothetical protein FrondiHNR_03640 [Lysinibacter sp. HNR]
MRRLNGETCGRLSLRLDALYCMLLGLVLIGFSKQVAEGVLLAPFLVVSIGIVVVVWAGGIVWMLARLPLRVVLRLVMIANLFAAGAVAFVSTVAATVLVVAAVAAVSVDIAIFAVSQAVALWALPAQGRRFLGL